MTIQQLAVLLRLGAVHLLKNSKRLPPGGIKFVMPEFAPVVQQEVSRFIRGLTCFSNSSFESVAAIVMEPKM